MERLLRFLASAVVLSDEQAENSNVHSFQSFYKDFNANRTATLSGVRGTGKTTVLKTIKRLADSPALKKSLRESMPQYFSIIEQPLSLIEKKLVWLDAIDMEILPGPTNLLAAILSRIEESVNHSSDFAEHCAPGYLEPFNASNRPLVDLRQLMADVTLAWDGNMPERGQHLDPDSFAAEVVRAERIRVRVPDKVSRVLESLIRPQSSQLFVLPIDDFDMSPTRCLELLRMIRMLNVPRLFTIVLGDLDATEQVLQIKLTGDLASVAGIRLHADVLERPIHQQHRKIASDAMRKLLPPSQRVKLREMMIREALDLRPTSDSPTLGKLLAENQIKVRNLSLFDINIDSNSVPLTYFFFGSNSPSQVRVTAAGLLKAPPREVVDLWYKLRELERKSQVVRETTKKLLQQGAVESAYSKEGLIGSYSPMKDPELEVSAQVVELAVDLYRDSIEEECFLDRDQLRRAKNLFEPFEIADERHWTVNSHYCHVQWSDYQELDFALPSIEQSQQSLSPYFCCRFGGRWQAQFVEDSSQSSIPDSHKPKPVGNKTLASMALCNDLINSTYSREAKRLTLSPERDTISPAAATVWPGSGPSAVLRWPTPQMSLFVKWDTFIERWSNSWYRGTGTGMNHGVEWVQLCCEYLGIQWKKENARGLYVSDIVAYGCLAHSHDPILAEWLVEYFVFLCPEFKVNYDERSYAMKMIQRSDLLEFFRNNQTRIKQERARHFTSILHSGNETVFRKLLSQDTIAQQSHAWIAEVTKLINTVRLRLLPYGEDENENEPTRGMQFILPEANGDVREIWQRIVQEKRLSVAESSQLLSEILKRLNRSKVLLPRSYTKEMERLLKLKDRFGLQKRRTDEYKIGFGLDRDFSPSMDDLLEAGATQQDFFTRRKRD
jgi:hypothetical protein